MDNIDDFVVRVDTRMINVLKVMDAGAAKIAVVLDEKNKVVGSITDGDVRRGLLSGKNLNDEASSMMNKSPVLTILGEDLIQYFQDVEDNLYKHIIVVNDKREFVKILACDSIKKDLNLPAQAVIMAGGRGLRLGDITKYKPKPMVEIAGKPMIEHLINKLRVHGFTKIVISVNYKKEIIKDYIGDGSAFGVEVQYVEESQPLGTAGALSLLPADMQDDFMVVNADLVTNCDFLSLLIHHRASGNIGTMCVREHQYEIPFGVVEIDPQHCVKSIEEKPVSSVLVSSGIYMFNKEIIKHIPYHEYCDMPDLIRKVSETSPIGAFTLFESWHDVGRVEDLNHVRSILNAA